MDRRHATIKVGIDHMGNLQASTPPVSPSVTEPKRGRRKVLRDPASPDLLGRRLFLNVREYSELTGVPVATVYKLIANGEIDGVVRIGNSLRIPVSALKGLVAA
jgi:excisionase family DNA binding protein